MRLPDWLTGSVLFVLALVVLWHVQSFPEIPGQPYGAALFPGLAAVGLAAASLVMTALSLRRQRSIGDPPIDGVLPASGAQDAAAAAEETATPRGRRLLALGLSVAAIAFYAFVAPTLGFIPTGALVLAVLMLAFGTRPLLIVPVALTATLLIHAVFYKLLKVPLPWGILQPIAW